MSNLAALLDEVMNDTPIQQTAPTSPSRAIHGTRRTSSEAGLDAEDQQGVTADRNTEHSEATRLSLAFAEMSMDHHGLEGGTRDIVRRFVMLDRERREIELFVVGIALARSGNGSLTAANDFTHSQTFTTQVMNQLRIVVIVPHTIFYVTPLQEWVINHMRDHSEIWKIPKEVLDNNDQWVQLMSTVRTRLTTIRSQTKTKLFEAHCKKLDINQVLYMIAPKSAAISEPHCARWAWIALSIDDFNVAVVAGEYQKEEFWSFIEHQLAATKKAIWTNPRFTTDLRRYDMFVQVFMAALHKHNLKYPTRVIRGRTGIRPAWQAVLEESMGMGHEIYATMQGNAEMQDGLEEEEEEEEEGEGAD